MSANAGLTSSDVEAGKRTPRMHSQGSASHLERRMEQLEKLLEKVSKDIEVSSAVLPNVIIPRPLQFSETQGLISLPHCKRYFESAIIGDISSRIGFPFFTSEGQQWIQLRSGVAIDFQRLSVHLPEFQEGDQWKPIWPHRIDIAYLSQDYLDLPPREITEAYFAAYKPAIQRMFFPVVDLTTSFTKTIDAVYSSETGSIPVAETACVLGFMACAAKFQEHDLSLPSVNAEKCSSSALRLIPEILERKVTPEGVEALLLLALHQAAVGGLQSADVLITTAARMVFMLGGHLSASRTLNTPFVSAGPAGSVTPTSPRLRGLFWICYTIDKDLCLRMGRLPSINDEECDLELPSAYFDSVMPEHIMNSPQEAAEWVPFFSNDLCLAKIKSKAFRGLYSTQALRKSDAELVRTIRELDEELYEWRVSFQDRYKVVKFPVLGVPSNDVLNMHIVLLRLEYYHCLAMIHRASTRCQTGDSRATGVSSSLELCIEASRSTILYLDSVHEYLGTEKCCVRESTALNDYMNMS
ncbi:MAG: hypothetical protein M1834_003156 [Cirrosporium novae-zelandiae]|nr:MAG: hypothetical protein M1834_003156 [Cirrosporium novae-zelandiae]